MNELNKKLAKWRWPNAQVYIPRAGGEVRVRIDGQTTQYDLFTQSLNACFEQLIDRNKVYNIEFGYPIDRVICKILALSHVASSYYGLAKKSDPNPEALALCKAIEQLADAEAKTKQEIH